MPHFPSIHRSLSCRPQWTSIISPNISIIARPYTWKGVPIQSKLWRQRNRRAITYKHRYQPYSSYMKRHRPSKHSADFPFKLAMSYVASQCSFNLSCSHDVLIFLTGQEEIESAAQKIRIISKVCPRTNQAIQWCIAGHSFNLLSTFQSNQARGPTLRVYPLYSQLPQNRQMEVFNPSAPGTRKVIVSTNIAETSLTIPGIKYVIDSGVVKRRVHDPVTGIDLLKVVRISQDQAWQRCGRAGRDSDGFCYRTYTHAEFSAMPTTTLPEIMRSNITATV